MELALSLGDSSKPFSFLDKKQNKSREAAANFGSSCMGLGLDLGGRSANQSKRDELDDDGDDEKEEEDEEEQEKHGTSSSSSDHPPLQLELLPFSPVPRPHQIPPQICFPWLPPSEICPARTTSAEEQSSPNSAGSSFKRFAEMEAPDDDENGSARKKLRLSKEQSAFLEESFKEHHTLNPKQKLGLAKQLNLRPRQVEVWFQNRRARTKLKQTEVDCEYLKRCCETLTEENRRLQKELHELRALKTSQPFHMHLPATTLTMCPSCERTTTTTPAKPISPFPGPQSKAQAQAHKLVS